MKYVFLLVLPLLLLLPACATRIKELPKQQLAAEPADPEHRLCRSLLMDFLKNRPDAFLKKIPEDTRKNFDRKQFLRTREEIVERLGEPVSFQYVTSLKFPSITPHIWKITFSRKRKNGEEIQSEVLFRILTGKATTGEVLVIGFNFL